MVVKMGKLMTMSAASLAAAVVVQASTTIAAAHATRGATISVMLVVMMMMIMGCKADVESNLQYKEYWYKTDQLCPDLQEAVAGKDIDTANLPYKSVFRFMDHLQSVSEPYADLPCILEANGPKRLVSTALIEAIHVDTRPWNYTSAETCEEHIKLRLPEPTFLKRSNVPKIICRIPKSRNGLKENGGSLFHPYVWQFQKGKLGLSFSSFNLSHVIQQQQQLQQQNRPPSGDNLTVSSGGEEQNEQNGSSSGNSAATASSYWLDPDPSGRQFVQIVFTTRFGGMCTVRVQQYLVDPQKTLCGDIQTRSPFRLCGVYDCSEKEDILRTLGFWTHRKVHDQLDILLQTSGLPRWRREEPSYLEILVSTLRALIMPLLFLSVFYVTRRLRLKLANRHHPRGVGGGDRHRGVLRQRQCYLRSLMREGSSNNNNNNSSGSSDSSGSAEHMLRPSLILNHVVYDIPVGGGSAGEYPIYEDLPPPYESIVQPPSYQVATTQVKQASSPCPMMMEGVSLPLTPPPTSIPTGEGNNSGGVSNIITTPSSPSNNSTTVPVVISSASQQNSGSRFSILDEDVVFHTPDSTHPPTTATFSIGTVSPSQSTVSTAHYPSV